MSIDERLRVSGRTASSPVRRRSAVTARLLAGARRAGAHPARPRRGALGEAAEECAASAPSLGRDGGLRRLPRPWPRSSPSSSSRNDRVDLLVNAAGNVTASPLLSLTPEEWDFGASQPREEHLRDVPAGRAGDGGAAVGPRRQRRLGRRQAGRAFSARALTRAPRPPSTASRRHWRARSRPTVFGSTRSTRDSSTPRAWTRCAPTPTLGRLPGGRAARPGRPREFAAAIPLPALGCVGLRHRRDDERRRRHRHGVGRCVPHGGALR